MSFDLHTFWLMFVMFCLFMCPIIAAAAAILYAEERDR